MHIRQVEEEKAKKKPNKKHEIYNLGRLLFVVVLQFLTALSGRVCLFVFC